MSQRNYIDFDVFSRALIASRDVDPVYPFVKRLLKVKQYQPDWFMFCYVAFYSLETAIKMCDIMPTVESWKPELFNNLRQQKHLSKFGHERRGTARNVDNQIKMFDSIVEYIQEHDMEHFPDNQSFRKSVQRLPQHSVWASFKLSELYEKSLGCHRLWIPDLGLYGRDPNSNDGPVAGLRHLFGTETKYDESWFEVWDTFGQRLAKTWGVDIGEVETCLCKFHKFKTGKYYIGHDIHELTELRAVLSEDDFESCMQDFDLKIWEDVDGVQKKHKGVYNRTYHIVNSQYADALPEANVVDIILSL